MGAFIRLASAADAARVAAIYAPAVTEGAASFETDAPDAREMARRIAHVTERTPWLCCEAEGRTIGYAYASPHRDRAAYQWSVEVSAYVAPEAQRRGVARALYTSLFALLALQEFRTAYAGIVLPNEASVRLHQAMGFSPVGVYRGVGYKLGAWRDVAWYERALRERGPEPAAPRPLPGLVDLPAFAAALSAGSAILRHAAPEGARA
jgi:phosphinothricin acetyltransferase